ncbi:Flp pilus assembly protein CpaB [Maricurvus nonylphenolicus]|uniref:Flp pilus assembly protein CpaB n=1 Tax=Maricurvus nonylphenolicus TaxID=1008307 RepID=UPI0036F31796
MHVRGVIVLVLALVMGGVSVKLVNTYLDDQVSERKAAAATDMSYIVVADRDLEFGDHVDEKAIRLVELEKDLAPDGAFTSIQQVLGDQPAIALMPITENEVILPHKLSPHGARGGLPAKIPEDMRAMTISVNEVKGVAGFVLPGDFVDILHTTDVGRKDKNLVTRVVAQNVNVLGVDQISSYEEDEPRVVNAVTLLVSQRDGQRLTLAQQLGDLNLLLRNEFDGSILKDDVVAYNDLMTVETGRKPVVRTRYRRPSVQVIRGLEVKKQQVSEAKPVLPKEATAAGGSKKGTGS